MSITLDINQIGVRLMTIAEYLKNPYGKGAAFTQSSKQKEELEKQLEELDSKFIARIYRYRDFVIYHVVVPSVKKDYISYDVVIEVETKRLTAEAVTLEGLEFKVFSNCPSFIFTYANVFRNNGMLCEWLLPKYNKEVRTKAPVQRNAYGIVGLERSLYLAMKYLHKHSYFKNGIYQTVGKKINGRTEIINSIRTQNQILERSKIKVTPNSKLASDKTDTTKFKGRKVHNPDREVKVEKRTLFTKSVKNVRRTRTTKTQKTTKKI